MKDTQLKHGVHVRTTHPVLKEFRGTVYGKGLHGRILCVNDGKNRYNDVCSWAPEDLEATA
jgi:hypothetical protein